jgi:hypothetical protein
VEPNNIVAAAPLQLGLLIPVRPLLLAFVSISPGHLRVPAGRCIGAVAVALSPLAFYIMVQSIGLSGISYVLACRCLAHTAISLGAVSARYSVQLSTQLITEELYLGGGVCFPGYQQLHSFLSLARTLGLVQWSYSEEIPFTVSLPVA